MVQITLQYFDDCPNWQTGHDRLMAAIQQLGPDRFDVDLRLIGSPEQAVDEQFRGSPSFRVDGVDPFAERCSLRDGVPGVPHAGGPGRVPDRGAAGRGAGSSRLAVAVAMIAAGGTAPIPSEYASSAEIPGACPPDEEPAPNAVPTAARNTASVHDNETVA